MKAKMFYDTEKAFVLKDASSLKRTVFLFRVINSPALVKFLSSMVKFGIRIGLPIKGLIRSTIFNQFCAGETLKESKEVVDKLYKANVKSILDYSVEGEENNASFDKNLSEIVKVIEMAAGNPAIPYTSVKFTGLVSSEILEKVGEKAALTESESRDHEEA
jgi:proline dehydrogenase